MSKILDPLGLLKYLQKGKLHWVQAIPMSIYAEWIDFYSKLLLIYNLTFPIILYSK